MACASSPSVTVSRPARAGKGAMSSTTVPRASTSMVWVFIGLSGLPAACLKGFLECQTAPDPKVAFARHHAKREPKQLGPKQWAVLSKSVFSLAVRYTPSPVHESRRRRRPGRSRWS